MKSIPNNEHEARKVELEAAYKKGRRFKDQPPGRASRPAKSIETPEFLRLPIEPARNRKVARGVLKIYYPSDTNFRPIQGHPEYESTRCQLVVRCPICDRKHRHSWDSRHDHTHVESRVSDCGRGSRNYWISVDPKKRHCVKPGRMVVRPTQPINQTEIGVNQ
ncbi:hypothetical protein MFFC18_38010 [Mariniblastus fucicola]|uniref:Uncharacterized protein n=1 Tax=Mariniblastus fucicola TaxID=980251 RepID=A0A5B9PAZ9_9BACT|nr:hypothetical protein MFFC18_38010 [Mariniblastus fucicola]